jgi:hypothetical protein
MPGRREWWVRSSPPAAKLSACINDISMALHRMPIPALAIIQDVSIEEDWPRVIEATERGFGAFTRQSRRACSADPRAPPL